MGIERIILEYHANAPLLGRKACHLPFSKVDLSLRRF